MGTYHSFNTNQRDGNVWWTDWQVCVDSASMGECLPQEMLEAILGNLDRPTVCTARLVSRAFCAAASAHISSLTARTPPYAVNLERLPRLRHVRVHHMGDTDGLAELDPRVQAVIPHLTVSPGWGSFLRLPELPGMPKLRELDMS